MPCLPPLILLANHSVPCPVLPWPLSCPALPIAARRWAALPGPVLSMFALSWHGLPYPAQPSPIMPNLSILHCHIMMVYPAWPCLARLWHVSTVNCPVLSCPARSCTPTTYLARTRSYSIMFYLARPCPALSYSALPCLALPRPALADNASPAQMPSSVLPCPSRCPVTCKCSLPSVPCALKVWYFPWLW